MNLNTISLIITGVILFIIILSFLIGIIKGFKKSLANGLYNLLLVVLLLIFTKLITGLLINADLSMLNIVVDGKTVTSVNQLIIDMLASEPTIAEMLASSTEAVTLIASLPIMIASPIVFTLLYWIIKLIVFIISLIGGLISLIFLPFKKKKKPQIDPITKLPIKEKKKSKKRLLGGLIGAGVGLIIVFATFMPVFGIAGVLNRLNSISLSEAPSTNANITLYASDGTITPENQTLFTTLFPKEAKEYLDLYNSCIGVNIARYTGIESLSTLAFNNLASTRAEETTIKLIDEVDSVVYVYKEYLEIDKNLKKETLTKEEIDETVDSMESLIENAFNVKTVSCLGNYLLPKVVDGILNDPNFAIKLPEEINNDLATKIIVEGALNAIKEYPFDNVKNVLLNLTSTIRLVNENNVLAPIYNSTKNQTKLTLNDYITILKSSNDDFAEKLSEKITSINLIEDLSPSLIDGGLTALFASLDLDYETNNITKENAHNIFDSIVTNIINLFKSLNTSKDYLVSDTSFTKIGNILNITKDTNLLTTTQYNSLITKLQTELKNFQLPVDITTAIDNLSSVDNWTTEMEKLSLALPSFDAVYSEVKNMKEIDITSINLVNFGKLFDKLEDTTIFNGAIQDVYNDALDLSKESLTEFSNVFEILKITETNINWEKELTSISPLIKEINDIQNLTFTDARSTLELLEVCAKFDEIENDSNSQIFSTKMESLLKEVLISLKNMTNDSMITDIVNKVNTRIDTRTTETLETCVIKGIFDYSTTLIPSTDTFDDTNIKLMIAEIKSNIESINSGIITNVDYKQELNYILDFADKVETLQNFEDLEDSEIIELSNFLDSLNESKIFNNAKTHIINFVIDTAKNAITNDNLEIKSLLENLKNNISVSISTLIEDMNTVKEVVSDLNIDTSDVENLDTDQISLALETIRNTQTFDDEFTNSIMKNILSSINEDAQNNSMLPSSIKEDIDDYCVSQSNSLDTTTISSSTYKNILDGLVDIFTI